MAAILSRLNVLKVITMGWSHFQSASNKPRKFVYFVRVVIWQENQQQALC